MGPDGLAGNIGGVYTLSMIKENVRRILTEIPEHVILEAAAKTRTVEEIQEAIAGGIKVFGQNYYQELRDLYEKLGNTVEWHFIGHLQRNKVKYVVEICDMIETLDSPRLAKEINKECKKIDKVMPVLVEINSGEETEKYGMLPDEAVDYVREVAAKYPYLKLKGLMTMGPFVGDPENSRPYFRVTKALFNELKELDIENVDMEYLSMGMTNSYEVAIEEGANIIRIGTKIFGPRE